MSEQRDNLDKETAGAEDQDSTEDIQAQQSDSAEQDLEFYLKTIEELRTERDEYYELFLRKQAEFENYRKRVTREREEDRVAGQADLIREILPILDAAEKGLESLERASEDELLQPYRLGYQLLIQQLRAFLEKSNVSMVPGVGSQFDPRVHEAVLRELTDKHEEGVILDEYRKGYQVGNRLLRPSQVKVAVQPENELSVTGDDED